MGPVMVIVLLFDRFSFETNGEVAPLCCKIVLSKGKYIRNVCFSFRRSSSVQPLKGRGDVYSNCQMLPDLDRKTESETKCSSEVKASKRS